MADSMNFAGMVASLLGESVELAAWTGPVLVHKVVDLEPPAPPAPKRQPSRPRKASSTEATTMPPTLAS